jgi:hypothetical protein
MACQDRDSDSAFYWADRRVRPPQSKRRLTWKGELAQGELAQGELAQGGAGCHFWLGLHLPRETCLEMIGY